MTKRVNLHCPINFLSYGLVSTHILNELVRQNVEVSLFPINEQIEVEPQYYSIINQTINNSRNYDANAICLKIFHQFSLQTRVGKGKFTGFPIFELDNFTPFEISNLSTPDELFVCSRWAKEVIRNNNITIPVNIVPLGVDQTIFRPLDTSKPKNKTIFLSIGKWEKRKNHLNIPIAFNRAFTKTDNVELWMSCDSSFLREDEQQSWKNLYLNRELDEKIKFIPRQSSQQQIAWLMNQATFGLFPSLAEGWCLPALEMMACSKPCIVTNYSGFTEYCNKDNSLLIDCPELEKAEDGKWFGVNSLTNQGQWAKFGDNEMEQLINHFRNAHQMNLTQDNKLKGFKEECLKTSNKFTWENSVKMMYSLLE